MSPKLPQVFGNGLPDGFSAKNKESAVSQKLCRAQVSRHQIRTRLQRLIMTLPRRFARGRATAPQAEILPDQKIEQLIYSIDRWHPCARQALPDHRRRTQSIWGIIFILERHKEAQAPNASKVQAVGKPNVTIVKENRQKESQKHNGINLRQGTH